MTFREAMQAMLDGKAVRRKSWCDGGVKLTSKGHLIGLKECLPTILLTEARNNDDWEIYEEPRKPAEFEVWWNDKTGEIVPILTKEPGDFRLIKVREII